MWLLLLIEGVRSQLFSFPTINEMHRCQISTDTCPNPNISFFLYTRQQQQFPHQLDLRSNETIDFAPFVRGRPIVVLIHGYTGHRDYSPNTEIRPGNIGFPNAVVIYLNSNSTFQPIFVTASTISYPLTMVLWP